jgi:hypothetical protein
MQVKITLDLGHLLANRKEEILTNLDPRINPYPANVENRVSY